MKKERKVYAPCSEKQRIVLQDVTTDVILLGGGAGGGKSHTCLTKNLDGIKDRTFRCVILRRDAPELQRPGGLIDCSQEIYSDFTKTPYKTQKKIWKFPSGAEISFSAIGSDKDMGSWQGSQLTRIMVDEAAEEWTQKQILFLLSRLRTVGSKIHPQLILTANPNIDSFLKSWVEYCLDPETGVPVDGTEKIIRWFVVEDNVAKWGDSPEECFTLYGEPKGQIYAHGMSYEQMDALSKEERTRLCMPKSFRFIPTNVFDNPYLLPPRNTSYLSSLTSQPYVNQLKFLHGSWTAKEEGSSYFNRSWCKIVEFPPENATRIRAWDFASEEKTKTNNPDWSAGVRMSRDKFGTYYVEDVIRDRISTDRVLKLVADVAHRDGVDNCTVCIPLDPAASGKTAAYFYRTTLAENGVPTKLAPTTAGKAKLTRFLPFCSIAEAGAVRIVRGDWNEDFFKELESFTGDLKLQKARKDDMVDACADAFSMLARQVTRPTVSIPVYASASPIPRI